MQFELSISLLDLRLILFDITELQEEVSVKLQNQQVIENCWVVACDDQDGKISLLSMNDNVYEFFIYEIKSIEFDSSYAYRGQSAKIFLVG